VTDTLKATVPTKCPSPEGGARPFFGMSRMCGEILPFLATPQSYKTSNTFTLKQKKLFWK